MKGMPSEPKQKHTEVTVVVSSCGNNVISIHTNSEKFTGFLKMGDPEVIMGFNTESCFVSDMVIGFNLVAP